MGSKGAALKSHIDATLGSGNLREAVLLPPGEDLNEWLAVNTVDFYNATSMLYAILGGGQRTFCERTGPKSVWLRCVGFVCIRVVQDARRLSRPYQPFHCVHLFPHADSLARLPECVHAQVRADATAPVPSS